MAYDKDQKENNPLNSTKKRSSDFLPKYFRTPVNEKFLHSTVDQLISEGQTEKISAYYGRKNAKAYNAKDPYVNEISDDRQNYKLEPAITAFDSLNNNIFHKDYIDYINSIKNQGGNTADHNKLNAQEYYAWNPNINWDKFYNFREYYWLPYGPLTVTVTGQQRNVQSTYSVTLDTSEINYAYVFSPDGLTKNPALKLYRGQTYKFNIDCEGMPFTIRTSVLEGDQYLFNVGVDQQKVEQGTITFEVPDTAPDTLFYQSTNDVNTYGEFRIYDIEENSAIDVDNEVIGKKEYTLPSGYSLSNGMKINFRGEVTPASYGSDEYYVDGVGDAIRLIQASEVEITADYTTEIEVPFDSQNFDRVGFGTSTSFATTKDYVVISKASPDRNPWSRYNRWVHREVVENSAKINGIETTVDQNTRARRPIIEFSAGLKLYKFGTKAKANVNLIDATTTDIFSIIEGSTGYYVDGVQLIDGMRVLFTADTSLDANNRVYKVKFVDFYDGTTTTRQISLVKETDGDPVVNDVLFVTQGNTSAGKSYYYNGTTWLEGQKKTSVNQSPLFELFDNDGVSFSDNTVYPAINFTGNKIFSYKRGDGSNDSELGFPLAYQNVENVGDILFNFDLLSESYSYQQEATDTITSDKGFLRQYKDQTNFTVVNGWTKGKAESSQRVIRQYVVTASQTNDFAIDVYDNSASVTDIDAKVIVDNKRKKPDTDYTLVDKNGVKYVRFTTDLQVDQNVVIKTLSDTAKNTNGFYEIASNLESNPLNANVTQFSLGEVGDHIKTIVESHPEWQGLYPGVSNLRDLGEQGNYATKFVQHAGPIALPLFYFNNKSSNVIEAIKNAQNEYGKFKRRFMQTAETIGIDADTRDLFDKIVFEINKDNTTSTPYYFSDLFAHGAYVLTEHKVINADNPFYQLNQNFDLTTPSSKSVLVYLNDELLIHGKDYNFANAGFVTVLKTISLDDIISVYEYETTDGCHVPETPTKLGLYPKFEPKIYNDTSYPTTQKVIQGHDGSITLAYNDYRDDLILELEKRIYNNIKVQYDENILSIKDYVPGLYRKTGITKQSMDNVLLSDFVDWLRLIGNLDYTDNDIHADNDSFTFNYSSMSAPNGDLLPGYWRAVYKHAFDTDTPHLTPWQMLGFSEEPTWWQTVYGPAPYTKDNLILWTDLQDGVIREPNKSAVFVKKYARPNLLTHIPVDSAGNLLSPLDCNFAQEFVLENTKNDFVFGDEAPIETAWRRSSYYPFALMSAILCNKPAKFLGLALDRSRITKNSAGQFVYGNTNNRINPSNLIFHNTVNDTTRSFTAGLTNYITDYVNVVDLQNHNDYIDLVKSLQARLSFKIRGYTSKEKFKIKLDSKTTTASADVFVPEEDYQIIFNTSTPVDNFTYSGLIIEKTGAGYIVRGYDKLNPQFKILSVLKKSSDPNITVGGVSAKFVNWEAEKYYTKGAYVKNNRQFYAVTQSHTSGQAFDLSNFTKIVTLPIEGGVTVQVRKNFLPDVEIVPYGTVYKNAQEVADFIAGYDAYLKSIGFEFENFDGRVEQVANWRLSLREFLFWSTQNWTAGAVISLSPSASKLVLNSENSTADNIFELRSRYEVLKEDGRKIEKQNLRIVRQDNHFEIITKNTVNGIYFARIPVVQKEHVCLFNNTTVFNDIIYQPEAGYRQERLKVLGYISAEWNGSSSVPGFIFDNATVEDWEPYKNYSTSALVKYKQYFYSAKNKVDGTQEFDETLWVRLDGRPQTELIPNFDYKALQFTDFYDLNTDNFDTEQQKMSQHLLGYQARNYLANIINDDVSQYKFYQGYIREKGTRNSLDKLFKALTSANKESIEFNEEWALRKGQFGASEAYQEVEFTLDESKYRLNPQPIELKEIEDVNNIDLRITIPEKDVYLKSANYNGNPFPQKFIDSSVLQSAGYVDLEDVDHSVFKYDDIGTLNADNIFADQYIWTGYNNRLWNVYKVLNSGSTSTQIAKADNITITLDTGIDVEADEYVVLVFAEAKYILKVVSNVGTTLVVALNESVPDDQTAQILTLVGARLETADQINNRVYDTGLSENETFWIDNSDNNRWAVVKNNAVYKSHQQISNTRTTNTNFGKSISVNGKNTLIAISASQESEGKIYVYERGTENGQYTLLQVIDSPTEDIFATNSQVFDTGVEFGNNVALSDDGLHLIVGVPNASNIRTHFKGEYSSSVNYDVNDIVQYKEQLWKSLNQVYSQDDSVDFSSFDSHVFPFELTYDPDLASYNNLTNLVIGDHVFPNVTTDHMLIRANEEQFLGTAIGDKLQLKWNTYTSIFPNGKQPFAGTYVANNIDATFLTGEHAIVYKAEKMFVINETVNDPAVSDIVYTDTGNGKVVYSRKVGTKTLLYVNEVQGAFADTGDLSTGVGLPVGSYYTAFPNQSEYNRGWWVINVPFSQTPNPTSYPTDTDVANQTTYDVNPALVIKDIIKNQESRSVQTFVNSLDTVQAKANTQPDHPTEASEIAVLTYNQEFVVSGTGEFTGLKTSRKWYVRGTASIFANKVPYDNVAETDNNTVNMWLNTVRDDQGNRYDPDVLGLNFTKTNKKQRIIDIWNGSILVQAQPDNQGNFYVPTVGDIVLDDTTSNTGEVAFVRTVGFNQVELHIKNKTGAFRLGSQYSESGTITIVGTPNRLMGAILKTEFENQSAGSLFVFEDDQFITPTEINSTVFEAVGKEYWLWNEVTIQGTSRLANVPSRVNKDWQQVYNIPLGEGSTSGGTNEGAFVAYSRSPGSQFIYQGAYTVPETKSNLRLGSKVNFGLINGQYYAFVSAQGNNETSNFGSVHVFKNNNGVWVLAKDENYKGPFDDNVPYYTNDIVYSAGYFYQAQSNVDANSSLDSQAWSQLDSSVDYRNVIPNTEQNLHDSSVLVEPVAPTADSTMAQTGLVQFAKSSDVSKNGSVIVTSNTFNNGQTNVTVYRLKEGHYVYSQTIEASDNEVTFGDAVSVSDDGNFIAVGTPGQDLSSVDAGVVYIYKQTNGLFELSQTLKTPEEGLNDNFGSQIEFDGTTLVVATSKGVGTVHVFNEVDGTLLYGEKFSYYADSTIDTFGDNFVVRNNHITLALTDLQLLGTGVGTVLDYRRGTENSWRKIRTPHDTVDLEKIKSVFVYNKKTKAIYTTLDYIDVLQGKIAGVAEQEIYYKTPFDPAVYNTGTAGNIDSTNHWMSEQVGRVWWDISKASFKYPYQNDLIYNNNNSNMLFTGASIDVYEWTESIYLPSQWDELSQSSNGSSLGISGTSKDGDNAYVTYNRYDSVAQRKIPVYYYWVKNKKEAPALEGRKISVEQIAKTIENPKQQGVKFIQFYGPNKFGLVNCNDLLDDKNTILNVRYWTIAKTDINIHTEYQILTENDENSIPNADLELSWFNSLIGSDTFGNYVPDINLNEKVRYGTSLRPIQSWFANRIEALKQCVERVNSVFIENLIVDTKNIAPLLQLETAPTLNSKLIDQVVDSVDDLNFIGVANIKTAKLSLTITDSKITGVTILDAGLGYKTVPEVQIIGQGTGAVIGVTLSSKGEIASATVLRQGTGYKNSTTATVRNFSVLVSSDSTLGGRWSIYEYNGTEWNKTLTQSINVQLYWEYADWYATGYNQFTTIDFSVLQSYELLGLECAIGDIVKIQTVGSGGWLLLEKIANNVTDDYTQNFKTVGKQNGTIQLKSSLYDFGNTLGYESTGYDTLFYDAIPTKETRIILETIRDNLLIEELKVEYNKLFFSSLRYAMSENKITDFAMKTSFVKAKHNVGELAEKITFNNDNLENYEDYIQEVKPYKTKIREYVSTYEKTEPADMQTTDFDLAPKYDENRQITPIKVTVNNSAIVGDVDDTYPDKHWKDNVGFKVVGISVADGGSGYGLDPEVTISGGGGTGATAKAVVRAGVIKRIEVTNAGGGYLSSPTVTVANFNAGGTTARLYAKLGESLVKSTHITSKFDRTSRVFTDDASTNAVLQKTATFTGNIGQVNYDLIWPMDVTNGKTKVKVDGIEILDTEFTITNITDTTKSYQRTRGRVTFDSAIATGLPVQIDYSIDPSKLQAFDRIQLFYEPTDGMAGKQLAQLVDGIDYGGVEISSLDFVNASGYLAKPYMDGAFDVFDETFEDEIFTVDGSTTALQLSKPLEQGVVYNVYRNGVRIDDPNYPSDGSTPILNSNAIMTSITGDGQQQIVDLLALGVPVVDNDKFEVRKSTSDGSFLADPTAYDTLIEGGNLSYTTASGTKAEDINVDGDGFVTPTTSKGPEELVPGHVFDTVDIQVYDRGGESGSKISSYNHIGDGTTVEYTFQDYPQSVDAVFVTVNNAMIDRDDYSVDFQNKKIIFDTAPAADTKINYVTMSNNGEKILDIDTLTGDDCTIDFLTRATYSENLSLYVTVNGIRTTDFTTFESDSNYGDEKRVVIRFNQAPASDDVVSFVVYSSTSKTFSEITHQTLTADGSSTSYALSQTPFNATPLGHNTIVEVNGAVLNPGFSFEFTVSNILEYELPNWQQPPGSASATDVKVYVNNVELASNEFVWDAGNSSVILQTGIAVAGDSLKVFVLSDGDYTIDSNGNLLLDNAPAQGQKIIVTQFSNHDIQKIERINFDVVARQTIQANTEDYYTFNQLQNGRIRLRRPASDAQYVWVYLNGAKLSPSVDYKVTNDQMFVKIGTPVSANDQIDLIHFSAPSFVTKFGFRQFKDMTNVTTFRRLGDDKRYYLAEALNYYDKEITLNSTEGLTKPNLRTLEPGVLFIDGERIEYFRLDANNKISQLRRGTKGTGIKDVYGASTEVFDQSNRQTVPYKDQTITQVYTYDGQNATFELGWAAQSVNEFELFVGGVRMRKNSIQSFDVTRDLDSPEADITLPAEYSVTNINENESTFTLTSTQNIPVGTKITVIRRVGRVWNEIIDENTTKTLSQTDNRIGNFLREKEVTLPQ